ncbi:MAG: hypothetical protein FD147_595 [Chloroflexi bacterium]|nr:MAG: hypothetical protein FD147_595 [Chloroflexota bacterium]MBA4375601.1 hypothetical protein [Anaerolinea sp.]
MKRSLLIIFVVVLVFIVLMSGCTQAIKTNTPTGIAPTSPPSSVMDGKTLLETRCTVCHTLDRVSAKKTDFAGWEKTVKRMISNGAELTSEEQTILIQYLADTYK